MVLVDRALFRVLPPMAPTTRSARLSIQAQAGNSKVASSSRVIIGENSVYKLGEGFQEESHLKVYKAKGSENPGKGSQRNGRIGAKKEKVFAVDPEEAMASDMEDFCASAGSVGDSSFSGSEVTKIRTSLLSWYDRNHRVLPWRINLHSCLKNPSYTADEPDEICEDAGVEAKEESWPIGGLRENSVHSAVFPHSLSSTSLWGTLNSKPTSLRGSHLVLLEKRWCCNLII